MRRHCGALVGRLPCGARALPGGSNLVQVLALIDPRRTPKTTAFGKKSTSHGARLQPIASRGAPQARKQAIWGDLGRYSTKAASKMPPTKSYSVHSAWDYV